MRWRDWRFDRAPFLLAEESPPHGTRGPASAGFTTVRIEFFVDDPCRRSGNCWQREPRGQSRGARARDDRAAAIRRMLEGAVGTRFGHMWLIEKFLE